MTRRLLQLLDANRSNTGFTIVNGDPEEDEKKPYAEPAPDEDQDEDEECVPAPGVDAECEPVPGEDEEKRKSAADVATIYVYDAIGGWDGVQAGNFVKSIAAIEKSSIHLRINSPGGDVFDTRAIKTALEQHPSRVTAFIDGLAASSASFLMMAADDIRIAKGAFVMIHNPWGFAMGDAAEMRATAVLLDQVGSAIRGDYAARTGLEEEELARMMNAETWMPAEEAVEKGFCDSIMTKRAKASAMAHRAFDLSAFDHPPKLLIAKAALAAAEKKAKVKAFQDLEASRARREKLLRIYQH